jgi:hypothetical protein
VDLCDGGAAERKGRRKPVSRVASAGVGWRGSDGRD